ncbi:hypothetical protein IQ07DRAFT_587333 [Pyrenochaeta sp. DS3sAY3a]|nr:hypothetical protein IQ07DRAFT_587333 [Pyrenochaeta sp. DS3sAY3a]
MSDLDGDSTMHSSPSLNGLDDDDEMFPDEALANNPSTPHHPARTLAASEISPPNSQPHARDPTSLTLNANGKRPLSLAQSALAQSAANSVQASHHDAETGYEWSKQEDAPGYEWKNTRAREEEARALDAIVDKGHQIYLKYGDPLDSSVPAKTKR